MPLRNAVLAGKSVDGYPHYLTWIHEIDLQHPLQNTKSVHGTVSASSEEGGNYDVTRPLYNSVTYNNYNWETVSGETSGWWQYKFSDYEPDHVIIGMYIQNFNSEPEAWPCKWQLLGRNTEEEEWTTIFSIEDDNPLCGWADCSKAHGRQYWFTDNQTAYKILRINIESNFYTVHNADTSLTSGTGNCVQFSAIRFYETYIPGTEKYDVHLFASESEPFIGTIACGLKEDENGVIRPYDKTVKLTESVRLRRDGTIPYAEMSDNFIYMAPYDIAFDENDELTDVYKKVFPKDRELLAYDKNKNYAIFSSTKRIQYGTPETIAKNCIGLLQCNTEEDEVITGTNNYFTSELSPWEFQIRIDNTTLTASENRRGSKGSYYIDGGGSTANKGARIMIQPRTGTNNWQSQFPNPRAHTYNAEFTIEFDFKYTGTESNTASDTNQVITLFDGGKGSTDSNKGFAINYIKPKKSITFTYRGTSAQHNLAFPVNIEDGEWHNLCISVNGSALNAYIHYDGKLVSTCNMGHLIDSPQYDYYGLGNVVNTDSHIAFTGYINNFRYVLDNCLYQGDDFEVSSTFDLSPIPDGTLWYDHSVGVIKTYDYASDSWKEIPLLPLGTVFTGRKENLLTDQPFGVGEIKGDADKFYGMPKVKLLEGWSDTTHYDAAHIAKNIFNFSNSGTNPWMSTNNADDEFITFETTEPLQFERIYIINSNATNAYRNVTFFKLSAKNTEDTAWTVLLDKSNFEDIGGFGASQTASIDYEWPSYLAFDFNQIKPFSQYRITIPSKTDIPWFSLDNYKQFRMTLQFKNAKPEILSTASSMIGAYWEMHPQLLINNNQYVFNTPTDNLYTDYFGYVEEGLDHMYKRRVLGQLTFIGSNDARGEAVYKSRNRLYISTGYSNLTTWANSPNFDEVGASNSTVGMLYVTIRRMY